MRILLVKPKPRLGTVFGLQRFQRLEPLELGYLAGRLPRDEHEVRIIDLRLYRRAEAAFASAVRKFRPDLIGFTAYSHEAAVAKGLAQRARELAPETKIVIGGHHATVAPGDLNLPMFDYIIRGEGTGPFGRLVRALAAGGEPEVTPGLLFSGERFDPAAADGWPEYPDPAALPLPRRDLWDWRDYYCVWATEEPRHLQVLYPPVAQMRTSYGCRMKCSFCVVPKLCGGVHRPRPVEAVVEELAGLRPQHVYFADDENFIDEEFAYALADAIERRGIRKRYFAWTRSTTVLHSPELLRRWRGIGLDAAFLGFEFPSDAQLRASNKGATVAANEEAHRLLRQMGIACHAAFMLRPEDGEAEFSTLRQYVEKMPPVQCSFTVCTPSPGTEDYAAMRPHIWVEDAYSLHDCMHPLVKTTLPLQRFGELFAELLQTASRRNPLRVGRRLIRPWELLRVLRAEREYARAFRRLYRDYPPELTGRER